MKVIIRYYLNIIFVVIIIATWSLRLFLHWATDFGGYYGGSYSLSDNYQLYKELFDHKGPLYYLFISLLGKVIGWGAWQAYFTLFITLLIFYLSIIYILSKRVKSNVVFTVVLAVSLILLYKQGANLSISLFQASFLITSFYFLIESIKTREPNSTKKYIIAVALFTCAVLVRIEVLIYVPIYLFANVFSTINKRSYLLLLERILLSIVVFTVLFTITKIYFGYSFSEYYEHNIEFHLYYKNNITPAHIYRPTQFSLLFNTNYGLIILFFVVMYSKHTYILKTYGTKNIFDWVKQDYVQRYILSILVFFLGLALWIISSSDKDYHLFFITIPLLFFVIYWGDCLGSLSIKLVIVCLPIIIYMLIMTINRGANVILNHRDCLKNPFCDKSVLNVNSYTKNKISAQNFAIIVGGKGWLYLFADTKPEGAINDWWMYQRQEPFVTNYLLSSHIKLLEKPPGYEFWIDNYLVKGGGKSFYFQQILDSSIFVQNEGRYSRYRVK